MAATVLRDPYQTLSRKIGYSVGLEKLLDRVTRLTDVYIQDRSLTYSSFATLITDGFGRTNAVEHFAHFYGSLHLVALDHKSLRPLYQLDTLAILRKMFAGDDHLFKNAAQVILTQCLIEADADIFLNGLLAAFDRASFRELLDLMSNEKDRFLRRAFASPAVLAKMRQLVHIKNESGGGPRPPSEQQRARLAPRTSALSQATRRQPLDGATDVRATISDDYLNKTCVTRKAWAEDLDLVNSMGHTKRGGALIDSLNGSLITTAAGKRVARFWGYSSDLAQIHIKPSHTGAKDVTSWDVVAAIHEAFTCDETLHNDSRMSDKLIAFLRRVFLLYRQVGGAQGAIRHALPLYVVEPLVAATYATQLELLPDLHRVLAAEFKKPVRRVHRMAIRGTSGAISFS